MASLNHFRSERLPASSLLEVVVALVVVFTVFGISMALYSNVTRSSYHLQQVRAMALLQQVAAETKNTRAYADASIASEELLVQKTITPSPLAKGIFHLHLVVMDANQKVLATRDELFLPEK